VSLTDPDVKAEKLLAKACLGVTCVETDGKVVGLLETNGCGKSTFLRCAYMALSPDAGAAALDKLDILKASNRDLARVLSLVSRL
jgi:iron complex transport system ATP-binding protein